MSPNSSWPLLAFLLSCQPPFLEKEIQGGFTKGVSFELMSGHPCAQMEVAVLDWLPDVAFS